MSCCEVEKSDTYIYREGKNVWIETVTKDGETDAFSVSRKTARLLARYLLEVAE